MKQPKFWRFVEIAILALFVSALLTACDPRTRSELEISKTPSKLERVAAYGLLDVFVTTIDDHKYIIVSSSHGVAVCPTQSNQ